MDVSEAVAIAKKHILNLFAEEGIANLGLEEAYFDESHDVWHITLGFARSWENPRSPVQQVLGMQIGGAPDILKRSYKIVEIPDKGDKAPAVKNYQGA